MKLARLLVVLAALLSLQAVVAGAAPASTVDECQTQLATLQAKTAQSSFTTTKDLENAVFKLDDAAAKLTAGKNADAVAKLTGFQTTVNALASAPKPKLDPTDAELLSTGAQGVIDCINAIGTA